MAELSELTELKELCAAADRVGTVRVEAEIDHKGHSFPIYSFSFGGRDENVPAVVFVGGVHGLERIGTRVLISYLKSFCELLTWDKVTQRSLRYCRVHFLPLLNPVGMWQQTRANGDGIDLMRNAPVEAEKTSKYRIYAGHRLSPKLPWYRGPEQEGMAEEARVLCRFVERSVWPARVAISLDVHSGFGTVDRVWFPYARSKEEFPNAPEVIALKEYLDKTYENHVYEVEPQSVQYTAHGDLWDHLYDKHRGQFENKVFIPFSLEIGSWIWIKKNPRQLLSPLGVFNPILPHRRQRVLRRHLVLFDFLVRAVISHGSWAELSEEKRAYCLKVAQDFWYSKAAENG